MRDKRKDLNHFTNRLRVLAFGAESRVKKLESNSLSEDGRYAKRIVLLKYMYEMLFCQYSMGSSLSEMQQTLERIVDYHAKGFLSLEYCYEEAINMISIAYCLEMSAEDWTPFIKELEELGEYDRLMGHIATEMGMDLSIPSKTKRVPYGHLVKVFDASTSQEVDIIKEYLTRHWYKGHDDSYWYGNHKDEKLYFGYWSFDSAAVVKILGLDPAAFEGVDYFPIDILKAQ
jgi:hypothetical protein